MKIYAISGLGADELLFSKLKIHEDFQLICLPWPDIMHCENMRDYAKEFLQYIDFKHPFGLLGTSFGGMLCAELANICNPSFLILISSAANENEIPFYYKWATKLRLTSLVFKITITFPERFICYVFQSNSNLLKTYLRNQNPNFVRKAFQFIGLWKNSGKNNAPTLKIKGDKDSVLPLLDKSFKTIKNGGHFMIYDQSEEVSQAIQVYLRVFEKHSKC